MQTMNTQKQNGYMLLFRSDGWYEELSHDEIQKVISQNNAWIERLIAQGKAKPGQALQRAGSTVSGKNGRIVSDGPFAESKEVIGGFLLLDVETIAEAIAIAQSSPSLSYGASIEVRPVAEECPLDVRARELAREEQFTSA
jgi:hypothetical protein